MDSSSLRLVRFHLRPRDIAAMTMAPWLCAMGCTPDHTTNHTADRAAALIPVEAGVERADSTQAITHIIVIDPAGGAAEHRDMTIVIRGDHIVSVGPSVSADVPPGAVVHDESGRFVIPGLWDAHVHLSQAGPDAFPLFIALGITSVRDMGSDFAQIERWKSERTAGALMPRILAPGPKLDGGSLVFSVLLRVLKPSNHEQRIVTSPADARRAVDALAVQGVDFIKVHNGLTPALYDAIVAESRAKHLPFAGHLPVAGPLAAAAAGQRTIEHGRGMLLCSSDTWTRIHSDPNAHDDAAYCAPLDVQPALFPALVHAGTWFTPTLVSWRGNSMVGDPSLARELVALPGYAAAWPALRHHWDAMAGSTPTAFERQLMGQFGALAAAASRAGVPLLAGTDLGDPYVIPGFALHDEFSLMVDAGVTPLAALQSATSEPARAFSLSDRVGAIAAGQAADLVVLDGDPLADIRNTRRIAAVVLNGHWLAH